jgi:hypothetical protein
MRFCIVLPKHEFHRSPRGINEKDGCIALLCLPSSACKSHLPFNTMSRHRAVRNLDLDGALQSVRPALPRKTEIEHATDELDDAAFSDEDQEEYREWFAWA